MGANKKSTTSKASKVKSPDQKKTKTKPKKSKTSKNVLETDEPVKVYNYSTTPGQTKDPEPKKKNFKNLAIYGFLICIILALLITIILVLVLRDSNEQSRNVCETPECITLAHQLHNFQDTSVDPCNDFYKYSCGKYYEHVTVEGSAIMKKNAILNGLLKEFLLKNQTTTSKTENAMKQLFWKCKEVENRTIWGDVEKANYEQIKKDVQQFGWPMMDPSWKPENFNFNELLSKVPSIEAQGLISFGIFSIFASSAQKLLIAADSFKLWSEEGIENVIKQVWGISDLTVEMKNDVTGILFIEKELRRIEVKDIEKAQIFADYTKLKTVLPSVNFDWIIQSLSGSPNSEKILKNTFGFYGFDQMAITIQMLLETQKRNVANYLIFKYIQSSIGNLPRENNPCHSYVMHLLPLPSIRVFVRNHFDKESLEDVDDFVEDIRESFIEMLKDSTWLQDSTRKSAIRKVEKMRKMIGYPKEFEENGALDRIFDVEIHPNDLVHVILQKIKRFSLKMAINFAILGIHINPIINLQANAMYTKFDNTINVFPPLMDEPLYHKSYPMVAKMAGIGFIIGHEIGHGFDRVGALQDENGDGKMWWTEANAKEFERKAICLIEQYNNYDDPSFGKNLHGNLTIDENIADVIGHDATWRAFKKLDSSKDDKIIGFEDYSTEKLYFQIVAMNWCAPRITQPLEQQLEDPHATESFRINGVFSNMKEFSETFDCPAGSPMNPKKKCTLF